MDYDVRRIVIIGIITFVIMGIGTVVSRAYHRGLHSDKPQHDGTAEIYTYSRKTRNFLTALGLICLVCAVGPLASMAWKYLGPNPTLPTSRCCYHPQDDVTAGIFLLIGFGLGAFTCLVDPRKYYARVDDTGMTVRGLFSGVKFLPWSAVTGIKDHSSLQMVSVNGAVDGKPVRLWVPYIITHFPELMERLNEHSFFAAGQLQFAEAAREHLAAQGYAQAVPYKIFPPYLSFWRASPESQQIIGVLMGIRTTEPWEKPHYEHHAEGQGTWLDVMEAMQKRLERRGFGFYYEMQRVFAEDFAKVIAERRAKRTG